ncbi:MAG: protein TolR [Thermodesulfobacteriota bacterium]|nr:protein TolR [Thermodesulfobacteriota bacterium]
MEPLKKSKRRSVVSEINVTPFVDVMLVLLIIFMVTAPMMTQGVDVDLPETTPRPLRQEDDPIVITIDKNGVIFLNKIKGDQALLKQQLQKMSQADRERPIYLKGDKIVPYGLVVSVMADIKDAGFGKLGMITQPPNKRLY